jgi:AcrR family transcriptional regulator
MAQNASGSGRDKERTKQKLIDATIDIIREQGFDAVGVNAIAERAGVSKILIYRYFGSVAGLFQAVAERLDPLQARAAEALIKQLPHGASPTSVLEQMIVGLHMALKNDPLTKQLVIWELTHQNEITTVLSQSREQMGLDLTERFAALLDAEGKDVDANALIALVYAGVVYLTLRSDTARWYNGIDITSEEGWHRIARAVGSLLDSPSS